MRISPTTALLLVLKKCPEKSKLISTLLFNGRDDKNCDQFNSTLNSLASLYPDSHYEIVTTPDFISDDPLRRYFETEFAANFLHENLKDIDQEELDDLIQQNLS
ncbi:hypothetical protein ACGP04_05025 [Piscirickettsia salmonis]|uniref:hypothetical protein n=1 Tax=Piscirickettsia salmonis TaxID=1238 RepID=UPI000F079976|nr:hypothetical protein DA717_09115 [Piscirickettsiaceae bacterium NZ-RLO2]